MTKKSIKPQQVAPVQREISTTSSAGGATGLTPLMSWYTYGDPIDPFAGDDAE